MLEAGNHHAVKGGLRCVGPGRIFLAQPPAFLAWARAPPYITPASGSCRTASFGSVLLENVTIRGAEVYVPERSSLLAESCSFKGGAVVAAASAVCGQLRSTVELNHCNLVGPFGIGLAVQGDATQKSCRIEGCKLGIAVMYTARVVAEACQIRYNNTGLSLSDATAPATFADCAISSNESHDVCVTKFEPRAIHNSKVMRTFRGCSLHHNTGCGISTSAPPKTSLDLIDCAIFENAGWGINCSVDAHTRLQVTGGHILANKGDVKHRA